MLIDVPLFQKEKKVKLKRMVMCMWVRNSLMQMVLLSGSTTFTTDCLMRLACLLGVEPLSSRSWLEAVMGEMEIFRGGG
jgi:hypothetical protein